VDLAFHRLDTVLARQWSSLPGLCSWIQWVHFPDTKCSWWPPYPWRPTRNNTCPLQPGAVPQEQGTHTGRSHTVSQPLPCVCHWYLCQHDHRGHRYVTPIHELQVPHTHSKDTRFISLRLSLCRIIKIKRLYYRTTVTASCLFFVNHWHT
jgi:hypothetical protein